MPRRKLTLEDAFAIFRDHNLQVEVKGIDQSPNPTLADFIEQEINPPKPQPVVVNKSIVEIDLYCKHSVSSGGEMTVGSDGEKTIQHSGIQTYGPGRVRVPSYLASELLYRDAAARAVDQRTFDGKLRSYTIKRTLSGYQGICLSEDRDFDLSGYLADHSEFHLHFR